MCKSKSELLDAIELKQKESARLSQMLKYYEWLESRGLSWDTVKGIRTSAFYMAKFRAIKRKAINPITRGNWQGIGVIPDICVPHEQALEIAYRMAMETISHQG